MKFSLTEYTPIAFCHPTATTFAMHNVYKCCDNNDHLTNSISIRSHHCHHVLHVNGDSELGCEHLY